MTALTGPVLAEYQDLFSSSTTAGGPNGGLQLGATSQTGDGRTFAFCLAGATTLVPGKLYQSSVETTAWEAIAVSAAAIGSTTVTITSSITATLNILAQGYLIVSATPGQGYTYKIKGNTAVTSATGMVVTLEDPIQVALTTGSTVSLVAHSLSSIILNPTTATGTIAGVAIYPVVNAQYGWIQTNGPAGVLAQGTIVVGEEVAASSTTAGAVVATSGVLASVGVAIEGITSANYGPVFLTIG